MRSFLYKAGNKISNHRILVIALFFVFLALVGYWFSLPKPLFNDPHSTVLFGRDGQMLAATVASDGQWRFPANKSIPEKYKQALLLFEDRNFYHHPGVNPYSLLRATWLNLKSGRIIAGGSTLTMQLIRLSRKGKARNLKEKLVEMILATRAEIRYSKNEIIAMYASYAPFGGNTVGLDAAAWRYFGRGPQNLSWAEAATLAVLPNSPALIHPGRNRNTLKAKRNKLLQKLYTQKIINKETLTLSLLEPLPEEPVDLPHIAPHLLQRLSRNEADGKIFNTSINSHLQARVNSIVNRHAERFRANYIQNAAVIVADIETGCVLAYVGNTSPISDNANGNQVDIITAPRSTGSILKPFLYGAMLDAGEILPSSLIPDVPVVIGNFKPGNFRNTYDGAVHAQKALSRSLNIPAVFMLKEYGVQRFYDVLKSAGMSTLNRSSDDYGLSLILGGAESSLWDLCNMYTGMARNLKYYGNRSGHYCSGDYHFLKFKADSTKQTIDDKKIIGAGAIWHTFNAMLEVNKPEQESGWEEYLSNMKVAWKTGTSYGFRDAWAIGLNSRYIVGVWVGNADGSGRPGLTGVDYAAPLMFEVFRELNTYSWFNTPYDDLEKIVVCRKSGYRASDICPEIDSVMVPRAGVQCKVCNYHKKINLDASGKYRVNSQCESVYRMKQVTWFVLPPLQELYFRKKDPSYKPLPPYKPGCQGGGISMMEFMYPNEGANIYLPVNLSNTREQVIFKLAHRNTKAIVYWHLDDFFVGQTSGEHQMALCPSFGPHTLIVVDDDGNMLKRKFNVISK